MVKAFAATAASAVLVAALAFTALEFADGDGRERGRGEPKGFMLGKVLPTHIREVIELTEEQERKIDALEKEVKAKLEKILTDEQKQKIETAGPPMPPGGDGADGKGDGKGKGDSKGKDGKGKGKGKGKGDSKGGDSKGGDGGDGPPQGKGRPPRPDSE